MFYDSKLYFYLLVESMCLVFMILGAETQKVKILKMHYEIKNQELLFLENEFKTNHDLRKRFFNIQK